MIRDAGEHALLVELASPAEAQRLATELRRDRPRGVGAVVPGLASVLIEIDPAAVEDLDAIRAGLAARAGAIEAEPPRGRTRTIPVAYGGTHGPDLDACAAAAGLTADELVRRHAATDLRVLFCGFAPGFAYLGELPEDLRVPRLETPRTHAPPGSVAIAGPMTGIYPADLPGGWRIIGRTPLALFDPHRNPPAYLAPGDAVRFEPIVGAGEDWPASPWPADDW